MMPDGNLDLYTGRKHAGNRFGTIDSIYRIFRQEGTALKSSRSVLHLRAAIWSPAASTIHQAHAIQTNKTPGKSINTN